MALIITLILLSITLVMAIAFLAVSRRERASVTTNTELTIARLAADAARSAAEAQIIANIRSSTNAGLYNNTLLVSTNYINGFGFVPGASNPTNVNYNYTFNNAAFTVDDRNQNIANLQFLPRAPVNILDPQTGSNDFRFYLDVNRNGGFEDTGDGVPYVESDGSTNGFASAVGDPQWIGVLAKPGEPHGPNNPFLARYCYFALPEGNSLDINYMHNQAFTKEVNQPNGSLPVGVGDGFFRNQGVGSWEINLAAFLADLNTNQWLPNVPPDNLYYAYKQPGGFANSGVAFDDARAMLSWRYGFSYNSLATGLNSLNGLITGNYPFNLDGYSDSPLQTTLNTNASIFSDNVSLPWVGADNFNHFYSPSDLFDPAKSSGGVTGGFTNRLLNANNGVSTYDRYTYYRLLDQLGTSSSADGGKMNLNYRNITNGMVIDGMETNLYPWTAMEFFTNAADRMLRFYTTEWFRSNPSNYLATYYGLNVGTNDFNYVNAQGNLAVYDPTGFGLTNIPFYGMTNQLPSFGINDIPVWVNGRFVYSSSVNRVLQLAANLFEATTNEFFPIVYRPIFEYQNQTNVFITDYTNLYSRFGFNTVENLGDSQLNPPLHVTELPSFADNTPILSNSVPVNVYGVPWIIGARKGFPNFNKLGSENVIQVIRKMQVRRKSPPVSGSSPPELIITNQMYGFSINNNLGVECWNSYASAYPNPVQIMVRDSVSMYLTNDDGGSPWLFSNFTLDTNILVSPIWPGYVAGNPSSFKVPISRTSMFLQDYAYYFGPGYRGLYPSALNYGWESNNPILNLPQFGLLTTNQFQLVMLDLSNGIPHVIDYVQFSGPSSSRNINAAWQTNSTELSYANMWSTNLYGGGVPYGVLNQWDASIGNYGVNGLYWKNPVTGAYTASDAKNEIIGFCMFLGISSPFGSATISDPALANYYTNRGDTVQLPYTPTALIVDYIGWQANDPLVHYLASDLANNIADNGGNILPGMNKLNDGTMTAPTPNYTTKNDRYQPWSFAAPINDARYNFNDPYNLIYKDPQVWSSDSWDFPTNKLPSVGWIGRVHRGTPWQTVYLKARNVLRENNDNIYPNRGLNTWAEWTGDFNAFDAANSAPVADRMLFDLFTTRLNENAAHGTLSVNQSHLAAWSAVLGGMVVLTNNYPPNRLTGRVSPTTSDLIVNPAGVDREASPVWQIVTNINAMRSSYPQGVFKHVGDVLSALKLTEQSPFLNTTSVTGGGGVPRGGGTTGYSEPKYGISDEVYEWLPQQALGLLRVNTEPRYTIYTYGQTLKPTLNGTVLNGNFFGLITNYQVVAESAARATVTVQSVVTNTFSGPLTNYLMKVENYTVLPPE